MIELWRGNTNAWECDELGHMNVRFYLSKAMQAVGMLAAQSGLGQVYSSCTNATLQPSRLHVRFLAESHPGAPLAIEGGIVHVDKDEARIALLMKHAGSDRVAASFLLDLVHRAPDTGRRFPWPRRFLDRASTRIIDLPNLAAPRGIQTAPPNPAAGMETADELGLMTIGRGCFTPQEMDVFGRMMPEFLLGRVSDSVVNFTDAFPEEWDFHLDGGEVRTGSALLECAILPRRWPKAGDGYVIRSGLISHGPKVRNLVHWVLDPATGQPWWTMEGVAAPMDLDKRKLMEPDQRIRARLESRLKPGLSA